jgi:subtilisin family serine protease
MMRSQEGSAPNAAIGPADHWCPSDQQGTFDTRARAENLIGVPLLRSNGLKGEGVNVAIIDQGLNRQRLGGEVEGWPVGAIDPGAAAIEQGKPHGGHGMLVAANIRSIAPNVRLFDLPMLPKRKIENVKEFFNVTANEAFRRMLDDIAERKRDGWPGPWILVNAWAIFDMRTDGQGRENYANNPGHPFNLLVDRAVDEGHDVVFGAGNCGAFCPDPRCGPHDQGEGRSIVGASSNPKVVTVGAVLSDMTWTGYSSQGPGQPAFGEGAKRKPDLCAPSNFIEIADASTANGGTSTATALVAGVMAALRGRWGGVSPAELRQILNDTATPVRGGWNTRTGHGIVNARGAFERLSNRK